MAWEGWPHINQAIDYTEQKRRQLRIELKGCLASSPEAGRLTIVATGSYGRREASDESDLDFYLQSGYQIEKCASGSYIASTR